MSGPNARDLRNEEFLAETEARDLNQLLNSLDESSEAFSFIVLPASMQRASPTPPIYHRAFLADRRIRKMLEAFQRMPVDQASCQVTELFDDNFTRYQHKWVGSTIRPECDHYSVAAALFLCTEFCEERLVLNRIDRWTRWYEQFRGTSSHFDRRAKILPLFLLNTYCCLLVRAGTSIESLTRNLQEIDATAKKLVLLQMAPMRKWDSVDSADSPITNIPIVPSWSHRIRLAPELYDNLNQVLRGIVEAN